LEIPGKREKRGEEILQRGRWKDISMFGALRNNKRKSAAIIAHVCGIGLLLLITKSARNQKKFFA